MEIKVQELWSYPLKSAKGMSLPYAEITETGIRGDREYMLIKEDNTHVNQKSTRQTALLALVKPEYISSEKIRFNAPFMTPLEIEKDGSQVEVDVYGTKCLAYEQGNIAAEWFSTLLGDNYRLVRQATYRQRAKIPRGSSEQLSFKASLADGYNFLFTNTASLEDLNAKIIKNDRDGVPMNRFRPNIVLSGADAWAEDLWQKFMVGDIQFETIKACVRCAITTISQESGVKAGVEPLATLAEFRKIPDGVIFGIYAAHRNNGRLSVGDLFKTV